jgi:hypothetical protein
MNKKYIIPFVIICLFALSSCLADNNMQPEEEGEIIVSFSTRLATPDNNDLFIDKVRIFIFVGDELETQSSHITISANERFSVSATIGLKDVYVVANETQEMVSLLENVVTKSELLDIIASRNQLTDSSSGGKLARYLPRVGYKENVLVEAVSGGQQAASVHIDAVAILARINIMFDKMDENLAVTIENVKLNKVPNITWLWSIENATVPDNIQYNPVILSPSIGSRTLNNVQRETNAQKVIDAARRLPGADMSVSPALQMHSVYTFENLWNEKVEMEVAMLVNGREITHTKTINTVERGHHYVIYGRIFKDKTRSSDDNIQLDFTVSVAE